MFFFTMFKNRQIVLILFYCVDFCFNYSLFYCFFSVSFWCLYTLSNKKRLLKHRQCMQGNNAFTAAIHSS